MDIINSDDIGKREAERIALEVDQISNMIYRALKIEMKPGGEVVILLSRWPSDEVQAEVTRVCADAGWEVTFQKTEWFAYNPQRNVVPKKPGTIKVTAK